VRRYYCHTTLSCFGWTRTDRRMDGRTGRRRCTAYTALASLFADKIINPISVRSSTKQQCLIIGVIGRCYVGVVSTNLDSEEQRRCGHDAVRSCRVHRGTVETVEETCDWALTVTSRSLWTTSSRRWCRLFPLDWPRGPSTADRQVLRTSRPTSPTGTRNGLVWRSYVMTAHRSLKNKYEISPVTHMFLFAIANSSAVAEIGDNWATIDMCCKVGG